MPHDWHKSAAEIYFLVHQEREAPKVTPLGHPLLQCHPRLVSAAAMVYDPGHTHHQSHCGVSDPDNSGTPPGTGQQPGCVAWEVPEPSPLQPLPLFGMCPLCLSFRWLCVIARLPPIILDGSMCYPWSDMSTKKFKKLTSFS